MKHQLFTEIEKFNTWATLISDVPQDERGGEWKCGYDSWGKIYSSFADFLKFRTHLQWTTEEKRWLLYIIARDNEMLILTKYVSAHEEVLLILAQESILCGRRDDKWQLASQLYTLKDRGTAIDLLDKFVNDEEEYVNRIALMELARLGDDRIEYYCERFWNRGKYEDMEEYQRMAVLESLSAVNSKNLSMYIELAIQDGRQYLVNLALELRGNS